MTLDQPVHRRDGGLYTARWSLQRAGSGAARRGKSHTSTTLGRKRSCISALHKTFRLPSDACRTPLPTQQYALKRRASGTMLDLTSLLTWGGHPVGWTLPDRMRPRSAPGQLSCWRRRLPLTSAATAAPRQVDGDVIWRAVGLHFYLVAGIPVFAVLAGRPLLADQQVASLPRRILGIKLARLAGGSSWTTARGSAAGLRFDPRRRGRRCRRGILALARVGGGSWCRRLRIRHHLFLRVFRPPGGIPEEP